LSGVLRGPPKNGLEARKRRSDGLGKGLEHRDTPISGQIRKNDCGVSYGAALGWLPNSAYFISA